MSKLAVIYARFSSDKGSVKYFSQNGLQALI